MKLLRKIKSEYNDNQYYGDTEHECPIGMNWHLHRKHIDFKPSEIFYCAECEFETEAEIDDTIEISWKCKNPQRWKRNKWKEEYELYINGVLIET